MDVLWIEDNNEMQKNGVFESNYFNSYLSDIELEELRKLENKNFKLVKKYLKSTKNKIFLASNFKECIDIIEGHETPFHKVIIDIDFPLKAFSLSQILKGFFLGNESDYLKFIGKISDEYAGIILNHIIVNKYKDEYRWNKSDIYNNIVFLSGNNEKVSDFENNIADLYRKSFRYDSDGAMIRFFDKNSDREMERFLKWISEDQYTVILDKYTNKYALKIFLEIQKNRKSKDLTIISGNLLHLRQILESYIVKKIVIDTSRELEFKVKGKDGKTRKEKYFYLKSKSFDKSKEYEYKYIAKYILIKTKDSIDMNKSINIIPKEFKSIEEIKLRKLKLDYSWKVLSKLVHNDGSLTTNGEKLIKDTDKAINTINILYYQLKEIILWFGQVMEKIESENTPETR